MRRREPVDPVEGYGDGVLRSGPAPPGRKRKRSEQGCVNAANDAIVEELKLLKGKIRESSHLVSIYARAIISIQNSPEPVQNAQGAKQLKNIGNYLANQIQSILHKKQLRTGASSATPRPPGRPAQRPTSTTITTVTTGQVPARRPLIDLPSRPVLHRSTPVVNVPPRDERRPSPPPPPPVSTQPPRETAVVGVSTESDRLLPRDYAPAYRKQPWFVLLGLKDLCATSDATAATVEALHTKIYSVGYDRNIAKLRTCLTSLITTHRVIKRTSSGNIFLSERGLRSTELCPGSLIPQQSSSQSAATTPRSPPRSVSTTTLSQSTSSIRLTSIVSSAPETITECIELSDSDESEPETIRATSPITDDVAFTPTWSQPEEEPAVMPSQTAPVFTSDSERDLIAPDDEWQLVLLLDHREILSRRNRDILERKLLECNVTCEVRVLNVGDVQWIARRYRRDPLTDSCSVDELMLNVIIERKEVNDLSGSIVDRRYNEQKTRLKESGMTHVIYLVEGSLSQQTTVRTSGLQTALCRTQVQDQFFVQLCQNADETVAFLRGVHARLLAKLPLSMRCRNPERSTSIRPPYFASFSASTAAVTPEDWCRQFCRPVRTFTAFNAQFRKKADFTVGELYQMMLMQVPGLSASRTVALSAQFPTFHHLCEALERGESLDNVRYGELQRRLDKKVPAFLAELLLAGDYEDVEQSRP
ncbi:hypothetical protein Poli38472_012013 [Pythium oligandrum]|uniref:Crossover junction endonuclease MUS81 n=1 Tax=Pythium oligandrum TaxID=41045 RepID=A0A8K1CQN6_PYTOL|nr:hypothetical protein Poli38472_012013 [Pythium oligandrum]|eukprot:TMW66897.1 hypothetical protein Poli38472_012013 [Pythium oligandrum]